MAKGQSIKRMRKHQETPGRGATGTRPKGEQRSTRAARPAAGELVKGERQAVETRREATQTAARQMERVMTKTGKTARQAIGQGESATRRTLQMWDSFFNVGQTVDLTRSWMAAAWNLWDVSTLPLRTMMRTQMPPRQRR